MMQQPETPQKCPYVGQDLENYYLVCKASNWNKKKPTDDTPDFRPIGREEIFACCSLAHLECPDFKRMKKREEVK